MYIVLCTSSCYTLYFDVLCTAIVRCTSTSYLYNIVQAQGLYICTIYYVLVQCSSTMYIVHSTMYMVLVHSTKTCSSTGSRPVCVQVYIVRCTYVGGRGCCAVSLSLSLRSQPARSARIARVRWSSTKQLACVCVPLHVSVCVRTCTSSNVYMCACAYLPHYLQV